MINDDNLTQFNQLITPICLSNKGKTSSKNAKVDSNDEQNLLRVFLNDMKKKLQFIEKTNWMFQKNFDIQFLQAVDPKLIDEHSNIFFLDTPNMR